MGSFVVLSLVKDTVRSGIGSRPNMAPGENQKSYHHLVSDQDPLEQKEHTVSSVSLGTVEKESYNQIDFISCIDVSHTAEWRNKGSSCRSSHYCNAQLVLFEGT